MAAGASRGGVRLPVRPPEKDRRRADARRDRPARADPGVPGRGGQRDARERHPFVVLVDHLRGPRLLVRARRGRRPARRAGGGRQSHPQLRGPVLDGGGGAHVRRGHPRRRHLPAQRSLHRRHASQRRADALSGVPRRAPRDVRRDPLPLGGRRRHDPGKPLGTGAGDLPGGAPHRTHPDLRSGADERRLARPALREHAHPPRAPWGLQHHARDVAQGGGAPRAAVRPLRRRGAARRGRGADPARRAGDARPHRPDPRRDLPRRGLSRQRRPRRRAASRPPRPHRRGRPSRRRLHRLLAAGQGADQRGAGDGVQRGGEHRQVLPGPRHPGEPRLVPSHRDREPRRAAS